MKNKITFKNDEITVDMPNAVKNLNVIKSNSEIATTLGKQLELIMCLKFFYP